MLNTLIFTSILSWGAWGIFDKRALQHGSAAAALIIIYTLCIPIAAITLCVLNITQPGWCLPWQTVCWAGCAAVSQYIAAAAYLKAMSKAEASFVLGITAGYPLIMQLCSMFILGERLVGERFLGGALIGLGVLFIGGSVKFSREHFAKNDKSVLGWIVVATLLWGLIGIFDKKAVGFAGPGEAYLAKCLCNIPLLLLTLCLKQSREALPSLRNLNLWKFCLGSALCLIVGNLSYLQAMTLAPASYVIVITGCYPIVMYLFALLFLKERLNFMRLSGVATVVVGGILAQASQSF